MNTADLKHAQARIDAMLSNAVADKLNLLDAPIVRRDTLKSGATVPVFAVPAWAVDHAKAWGLRVEVIQ